MNKNVLSVGHAPFDPPFKYTCRWSWHHPGKQIPGSCSASASLLMQQKSILMKWRCQEARHLTWHWSQGSTEAANNVDHDTIKTLRSFGPGALSFTSQTILSTPRWVQAAKWSDHEEACWSKLTSTQCSWGKAREWPAAGSRNTYTHTKGGDVTSGASYTRTTT